MEYLFWISLFAVWYAYLGYPLLLLAMNYRRESTGREWTSGPLPSVSVIVPVHNEQSVIGRKIENLLALDYPEALLEIIVVSDGSTDRTDEIIQQAMKPPVRFFSLPKRGGKAAALNHALEKATHELIVFSDASILLEKGALQAIVRPFGDPLIGCVSGEDRIGGSSGEGLYGTYELFLRRQESKLSSIVGASGSFYAQRRFLCEPFREGAAPDFLSVLHTVERGYRAVAEPTAVGSMTAVKKTGDEFNRKVRTLIRGMTALFRKPRLLDPFRYRWFALALFSHKIMRWLVPFFLIALLVANLSLVDEGLFALIFVLQLMFYLLAAAAAGGLLGVQKTVAGKIPLYFTMVNLAILVAWGRYLRGTRQEIWAPSNR